MSTLQLHVARNARATNTLSNAIRSLSWDDTLRLAAWIWAQPVNGVTMVVMVQDVVVMVVVVGRMSVGA